MNTALLSILTHQLLIGISPLIYKFLSPGIPSPVVVSVRWGLGAGVLLGWLIMTHAWQKLTKFQSMKQVAGLLFLGMFGAGLATLWNVIAVRHIGVVLTTLLINLELPLGVLFGVLILKEHLTKTYLQAAAIILVGFLLLLAKNGIELPPGGSFTLGIVYSLAAAVIWAGCTIVGKKLTATLTPSVVTFWRLALGCLMNVSIIVFNGYSFMTVTQSITAVDWLYLFWLGVVTSGIGMVLYYKALTNFAVKHISLAFTISPMVSVVLGVVTGEKPLLTQWMGIVLILAGIGYVFTKK